MKGKERVMDHADLHGTEVNRAINEKGDRAGMESEDITGGE